MNWQVYIFEDLSYDNRHDDAIDVRQRFRNIFEFCLEPVFDANSSINRDKVLVDLVDREIRRTTASGGVAWPHARTLAPESHKILCAVRFREPIKWPHCLDGSLVSVAFILLGIKEDYGPVYRMLASVSRMALNKKDLSASGEKFKEVIREELGNRSSIQFCN